MSEPTVSRPRATATWRADWYDGPIGSAMHHQRLTVRAYYAALRPDENGLPNVVSIALKSGDCRSTTIRLNRQGLAELLDALQAASLWEDKTDE